MKQKNRSRKLNKQQRKRTVKTNPETNRMAPSFEGDGEEVFMEMMEDLASFADMVGSMELILMSVVSGRLCPVHAMKTAGEMRNEVFAVMEKWADYAEKEA